MASNIFLSALVCVYLSANLGFGEHSCIMEGSSQIELLIGQTLCNHKDSHNLGQNHQSGETCDGCKHDDRCCHTNIYTIDTDQNTVDNITIVIPTIVLDVPFRITSNDLDAFYRLASLAFHTADDAYGPDWGLSTFAPLRL